MRKKAVALIDCNSFYVSCERVFNASIAKQAVIVLSNNDGCIVSLSAEAKRLGLKRGQPIFQHKDIIAKHHVHIFASNYSLYADMSARVMSVLKTFSSSVEVYSIDEAFLDLSHVDDVDLTEYARTIKARVWQHTSIPVSVGIGSTKCLAKMAIEVVKQHPEYSGVLDVTRLVEDDVDQFLVQVPVEDVWGIGRKYSLFLNNYGIQTARDLKYADEKWIRRHLTVTGERIVLELRGISCMPLETEQPPKQGIMCAKTFGREVTSREELEEAVATYTARVAEKLRQQDSLAGALTVFIRTNTFNTNIPQYSNSFTIQLPYPTAFTPDLIAHALKGLKAMYRKGFSYKKCGVSLSKITPLDVVQPDLFGEYSINDHTRQGRLMFIVDAMNRIYGRDTLFFAAQGITRSWAMRQMHLSARFTTRWSDILAIESLQTTADGR
jgi:DNA polymerase V